MSSDIQAAPVPTIRVLVVDDHEMFATSLALALDQEPDLQVCATAHSLGSARAMLAADPPHVVLLDQRLPDGLGVDAIPELKRLAPSVRIVMLTASTDDSTLMAATEASCSGFLTKTSSVDELIGAVRAAAAGEVLMSPALLSRLLRRINRSHRGIGADLTARELEVLRLIADGSTNAMIGQHLGVSINTVRNHVQNLLNKLGAHSKLEALSIAMREGLLRQAS